MRIGRLGLAICAAVMLAGAASAAITQYECRFGQEKARGGGWIPQILVLTENSQTGEILAYDPIIQEFSGNPIPARKTGETKARKTFTWEVAARNRGQGFRMKYTVSIFPGEKRATMRANPGGYDNSFNGEGTCSIASA